MRKELKDYSNVAVILEELQGPIDFAQLFGPRPEGTLRAQGRPVHIEIGSGKGTFLVNQAAAQPQVDFLGIEWARKYYRSTVDRIGRRGLTNVRVIRADAPVFLRDFIPAGTVDCFHIYFPDPWPKKRHHKRRLLQSSNLEILIRCLKPGGQLRIATDHEEYFQQIQDVTKACSPLLEEIEFESPAGARDGERTGTNYERKYVQENRAIHTVAFRKRKGV